MHTCAAVLLVHKCVRDKFELRLDEFKYIHDKAFHRCTPVSTGLLADDLMAPDKITRRGEYRLRGPSELESEASARGSAEDRHMKIRGRLGDG